MDSDNWVVQNLENALNTWNSRLAGRPPVADKDAAAATMVWKYVGELVFNMLVLVGMVRMSDHVTREMLSL